MLDVEINKFQNWAQSMLNTYKRTVNSMVGAPSERHLEK